MQSAWIYPFYVPPRFTRGRRGQQGHARTQSTCHKNLSEIFMFHPRLVCIWLQQQNMSHANNSKTLTLAGYFKRLLFQISYKSFSKVGFSSKQCFTYVLYQLKRSQFTPSNWYSLSLLLFLYSLELSDFFQSSAGGRSCFKYSKSH